MFLVVSFDMKPTAASDEPDWLHPKWCKDELKTLYAARERRTSFRMKSVGSSYAVRCVKKNIGQAVLGRLPCKCKWLQLQVTLVKCNSRGTVSVNLSK